MVWEATARVEQKRRVKAPPEKVWEIVGTAAGLTLMPGRLAWNVPGAIPGTDRLHCLLSARGCQVVDVREETPGRLISWQMRDTPSASPHCLTVSVDPRGRGSSLVRIAISQVVPRVAKADHEGRKAGQFTGWLDRVQAIAEGGAPLPEARIPAIRRLGWPIGIPMRDVLEASATVTIDAAPDVVWAAIRDPAADRILNPGKIAATGYVPGTPAGQSGEMQYSVFTHPDGRFTASVHLVTDLHDGYSAISQHIGPPLHEDVWRLTPADGGTRMETAGRWRLRADASPADVRTATDKMSGQMHEALVRFKAHLEHTPEG
jgi:uncharacterized protein YndB with AHSA1/START domain